MKKICTDINQSKKLIELGIDIDTADLTVLDLPIQNGDRFKFIQNKLPGDIFPSITDGKSEKIPAWSLSALMELMNRNCYNVSLNCHGAEWIIKFDDSEKYKEFTKDYAVDAAFEMIVWLKEKHKL